jgi:hypothetical protein
MISSSDRVIRLSFRIASNATNCWKVYGTSYLIEWAGDGFRTRHVFGDSRNTNLKDPAAKSMTLSEIAIAPTTKISMGTGAGIPTAAGPIKRLSGTIIAEKASLSCSLGMGMPKGFDSPPNPRVIHSGRRCGTRSLIDGEARQNCASRFTWRSASH